MGEVQVPRLEVLEQVRDVHVRAVREVAVAAHGGEPERLEVRDPLAARLLRLRRGEAEEELGAVRDQVGARDARGHRHLLRQALPAREAAADEAAPDARDAERPARVAEERVRRAPARARASRCGSGRRRRSARGRASTGRSGTTSRPRARAPACRPSPPRSRAGRPAGSFRAWPGT